MVAGLSREWSPGPNSLVLSARMGLKTSRIQSGKKILTPGKESMPKSGKKQPPKFRNFCITTFETKMFKLWKELDLQDLRIRYFCYQLETTCAGLVHLQAYIELYDQIRLTQLKSRLGDHTLHAEPRKGTRAQARDYCLKDGSSWFSVNYPEWESHGHRIPGTDSVELGTFRSRQGHRTDLDQVADAISDGKTELEIFEDCPSQYLKFSTGIRRARALKMQSRVNRYIPNLKVHVLYGDSRSGKNRHVFDAHGPENVYVPTWSESANKFWFDGYDGQKVLMINEFYGQVRTNIMQELLDHYRIQVEKKGCTTVSNWDTIYITSNCHPREWYSHWANVPEKVKQSFIERITTITFKPSRSPSRKTWDDCKPLEGEAPSTTLATSEPEPSQVPHVKKVPFEHPIALADRLLADFCSSPEFTNQQDAEVWEAQAPRPRQVETAKTCCGNCAKNCS